jgi:hypothetical protein
MFCQLHKEDHGQGCDKRCKNAMFVKNEDIAAYQYGLTNLYRAEDLPLKLKSTKG